MYVLDVVACGGDTEWLRGLLRQKKKREEA